METFWRVVWWLEELAVHSMFIAAMFGLAASILWITGRMRCNTCRKRDREDRKLKRSQDEATKAYVNKYQQLITKELNRRLNGEEE